MAQTQREAELVAGRYRVLRELARGGVGAVYEALDESTGRRVALKRLLSDTADNSRVALLFEAEYDTLARLRHPHIVEVYDYGIDKRGPYFTMELLDGQDLSELEPVPYREACRYLRDVASSLALLHTRRRLHRDLSPRNVRLTSDGRCRLLDFGTMADFGVSDDIVGTPPLVPPEALRGAALDHRADLYSLGALAYRILSGRYHYRARQLEDLPALLRTPPTRLREVVPDIPPELDELVMSMLNPDPTYRPNTTYEVIDRLTAIGALPPDADPGRTAQGYLVGTRMIGRVRQMHSIQRRIARAHRARGGVVVIEGNPGVGKSRLLDEAALAAQLSGALSVRVGARAHPGSYGVANAIVKAILEAAPHDAREAAERYSAGLRHVFEAFDKVEGARARGPAGDPPTRSQLHHMVLEWLFDLAEDRTLALLVDDLQRVDEGSAALLNALARSVDRQRILLICARRLADRHAPPPGVDAIVARARRLQLHRFRREDTDALLRSLFGTVPNVDALADWIHDVTTGSPMQIMELARHLVRENSVRFVDGLWVVPPHLPRDRMQHSLAAMLSARTAALPASERALAEALSVRRGNLSPLVCLRLSEDGDTRTLTRDLGELVTKGVLIKAAKGYHFSQDALRQVFLRQIPPARAKRLHLRLGEALLQYESAQPEERIEAGYHLILGGAEMRGADVVASVAFKLPFRGVSTTLALPALEAALEVYETHGRSPLDCLRLRVVLAGSMDRRATARYADSTLDMLSSYCGAQRGRRYGRWLGARAGFWTAYAFTRFEEWTTPSPQRGPQLRWAMAAFYRVAFGALSVRTSVLDIPGTEMLVEHVQSFAPVGPLQALVAEVFRAQLLAVRGDVAAALQCGRAVLDRFEAEPELAQRAGHATTSGVLATLQIGMGMLEAHFGLRSQAARASSDYLLALAEQTHIEEPLIAATETGAVSELELRLAAHQLQLVLSLARAHAALTEARAERRHSATPTGMHRQFEVWRSVIECNTSMRAMDVAGLRRCVETFTHWVAEHADFEPWLEIARSHLALCLGKPQEALAGYVKWLDHMQPGRALCWDTLHIGYAEALLASGESERARQWLTEVMKHPVVRAARATSAWATLEATLALAESGCEAHAAARTRIEALALELRDSDHPLVRGFVYEAAARIAHQCGDAPGRTEALGKMKRWYAVARNPALMLRGQRVSDSLSDAKPSLAPAESGADRAIVTRVTTRRERSSEPAIAAVYREYAPLTPEHARLLAALLEDAGAEEGFLYVLEDEQPRLVAALGEEPATLTDELRALAAPATTESSTLRVDGKTYRLQWLHDPERPEGPVAACILRRENQELRKIDPELLASTANSLIPPPNDEPD